MPFHFLKIKYAENTVARGLPATYEKPPSHPSGGGGQETMIWAHLPDLGYSEAVYRRADGSGYVGRVTRGRGERKPGE